MQTALINPPFSPADRATLGASCRAGSLRPELEADPDGLEIAYLYPRRSRALAFMLARVSTGGVELTDMRRDSANFGTRATFDTIGQAVDVAAALAA